MASLDLLYVGPSGAYQIGQSKLNEYSQNVQNQASLQNSSLQSYLGSQSISGAGMYGGQLGQAFTNPYGRPPDFSDPKPKKKTEEIKDKCNCCMRSVVRCKAQKSGYIPNDYMPAKWIHRLRLEILDWHGDILDRWVAA